MSHYYVYRDVAGYWRWRYIAANGRTIADSGEGYANRADAIAGINIMKASAFSPVRE
jgi:uncharacterized protein YegP (UPF0339 family)